MGCDSSCVSAGAQHRPRQTTRESFILTLEQWPTLAQRYLAADEARRRALLTDTVGRLPSPTRPRRER
jgi:hypothetical protein